MGVSIQFTPLANSHESRLGNDMVTVNSDHRGPHHADHFSMAMSVATSALFNEVAAASTLQDWCELLDPFQDRKPPISLHIAVMVQPYLDYILEGRKTVESRFSIRPIAPYNRVATGDIILMKVSGGPLVGAFTASSVWMYSLDPHSWRELRSEHARALCVTDGFWQDRADAEYATLIRVSDVHQLRPITIKKRDRRGWVVLAERGEAASP